jgi:GntR family frlABCD operon transcriptional regulator
MDQVNRLNPTPLYEQLKIFIRDQILLGELSPGSQLPSEQSLCEKYGVSRITVGRALNDLEREGFVQRIQGKGTIVAYRQYDNNLESIKGFSKTMQEAGHTAHSVILSIETIRGTPTLASIFKLPISQEHTFMLFRRVRYVDDQPAEISTAIVRESLGLRMKEFDLTTASFYGLYEQITGKLVIRNEATLWPITATAEMIELLKVRPGSPHFLFRGVSYLEGDIPVELCQAMSNGSLFHYSTNIYRYWGIASPKDNLPFADITSLETPH